MGTFQFLTIRYIYFTYLERSNSIDNRHFQRIFLKCSVTRICITSHLFKDNSPVTFICPVTVMCRCYFKFDRINWQISIRCLGFSQYIDTVVNTLSTEFIICVFRQSNIRQSFNLILLLKFEFCTWTSIAILIYLGYIQLIGKCNNKVFFGMTFAFFLFALGIHIRVIGVFKVSLVDISLASDVCISLQDRSEVYVDFCLIQACIRNLLFTILPGPGQVNLELMIPVIITWCQFISNIFFFRAACFLDGYSGNPVELQSIFKFIIEGDVVMLIICYVACQSCRQAIRDFITNIIVRRILPTRSISRGIINILNLFEEIRLV